MSQITNWQYKVKMSNKFKNIDIKNHLYYFFDNIINLKIFDPNKIKIDEKSYKNILIYYIGYMTIKDLQYLKINSVNPLYFIISKLNEFFEEINRNKNNESKEIRKTIWRNAKENNEKLN